MADHKERPILFSDPMVRAILSGQKTQTRRVVKPRPPAQRSIFPYKPSAIVVQPDGTFAAWTDGRKVLEFRCPHGKPGDRLWVREAHDIIYGQTPGYLIGVDYRADHGIGSHQWRIKDDFGDRRWRPSIHMPRWACRIVLEIVSVRVERLHDISEADARAEGILRAGDGYRGADGRPWFANPVAAYADLWESINGAGSWAANPWVWVIEFRRAV